MTVKSRKARNGTILYFDPSSKREIGIFFEESDFEWDQFTWQFQLTKGIPQSIEHAYGFEGSYAKVLDAMYTLLGNLDIIVDYEYVSTNVRSELKRCRKDIAFLIGVLENAYDDNSRKWKISKR